MNVFRRDHCLRLLNSIVKETPLDLQLKRYFNLNKSIGSHDRKDIAESVYTLVKYEAYFKEITGPSWTAAMNKYLEPNFWEEWKSSKLPWDKKYSFSPDCITALIQDYGKKTESLLKALNSRAPLTIRTNTLKIERGPLLRKLLESEVKAKPCSGSYLGITLDGNFNLFGLKEFKLGYFEVQDEASQLVALKTGAGPNMRVLDLCAGSGGKSLILGALMNNTGQLYLHDKRASVLENARMRCKRAGVQNYQFVEKLDKLKGRMDLVLVDAPCSGTGTYRRNPDQKLKFSMESLSELTTLQFDLLTRGLACLKPTGRLVYSTCSLLSHENLSVIKRAQKELGLKLEGEVLQTTPLDNAMDGFFCAVLVPDH
mmetsp:Transcript_9231/g.17553  ORF Transcript_9231/g.17553 Transcript_9231/m.17553 type:complete len:370 (+) Transcript_9231:1941-3050(+)